MAIANRVERAFYDINTAFSVLGRTAKIGPSDPGRALKEAKALRAKLVEFEAVCRLEIIEQRQAAIAKRQADKDAAREQLEYLKRNPHEIERAKALGLAVPREPRQTRESYVADGLVTMAAAFKEPVNTNAKRGLLAKLKLAA